jgi:hypothetical protein
MTTDDVATLSTIASSQAGVVSVDQALGAGVTRATLQRAVRRGVLVRIHPRVLRFAAAPLTELTRTWAAVLQVGEQAIVSHEAALVLAGVSTVPYFPVVTVERGRHVQDGIRVHRHPRPPEDQLVELDGLASTTVERAVVDVASVFSTRRLDALLDQVTISERATSVGRIERALRQVDRRGRRNIAVLQALLDRRRSTTPTPRSRLEQLADEALRTSGLPEPVHEHPLPSPDGRPGRVDRAWPEVRLIFEIDGRTWHSREKDMAKDRARDRAAAREGWVTVRALDSELRECPEAVIDDLVATYEQRRSAT